MDHEYIPRALAATLRRAAATFPAVLVTGARQVGKTTLLRRELGATCRYRSLERPDVQARAQADPVAFLDEVGPPVILDEIQHAPVLLPYIKERIDRDRSPGRWFLSGSQSLALMQDVSESLAGRVAVLTLDPLSVSEVTRATVPESLDDLLRRTFDGVGEGRGAGVDLADWLLRGGFPEPRANPRVDRGLWFSSYVQTYLERDVRAVAAVGDLDAFRRFLLLLGARTGNVLNMTAIGREVGVTGPTVKRWLSVLEASHTIFLLPPWHRNIGKRIRRSPKLHLLDAGLASWLLGLDAPEPLLRNPSFGALFETAVVSEWIKAHRVRGDPARVFYWDSARVGEVDLVLERGGRLYAIEAKATATPTPRHAEGLSRWLDLVGPGARGVLACRVEEPFPLRPRIRAVPWHAA
jgi:predicted AAA+ superfamily ATPase